ncbi:uncharacterized protein BX664DRAFT_354808 [Halteromyces radiatus]|uniref:uncharacterized protein n=1 Tax=Halteromyces radiatus TaxID=101107 RepID=UPI00221FCDA1|nr:uncharacterized protein BX664DRAFT_354808 [Halteromyces radiatus]KAI8099384.1 hypothetical protein BX664DRAFT_354808 [Halteromyces radiatus]
MLCTSRRTISDDIDCIALLNRVVDVSRKNVFVWLSIFCCWPMMLANAVDINQNLLTVLGLPRKNHCALSYNNTLFILQGQDTNSTSLSLRFSNDTLTPNSTQTPSIQWIPNPSSSSSSIAASICTVTSYGQAILFYSSLLHNATIDLNSLTWTITSSVDYSGNQQTSPPDLDTVAATIMNDDTVLVLAKNNTSLSTWLLDASNDQLQWTWSILSSSIPLNIDIHLNSATLVTTSSWILFFNVEQSSSSSSLYNVSIYCFDISSMAWIGHLLNFTSITNHVQAVMINNNNTNDINKNDTLLIVPAWIDTVINATLDENVTHFDAEQQQQIHQDIPGYRREQRQQKIDTNNNATHLDGYWILDIGTESSSSSSLPFVHLAWQPTDTSSTSSFNSINGGSATRVENTIIFYGGNSVNDRDMPSSSSLSSSSLSLSSLSSSSLSSSTISSSNQFSLRFWNITDRTFLTTPAWLSTLLSSSSPSPSPFPTDGQQNDNDDNHTLVIVLSTLLGVIGAAFLLVLVLLWWRHKKKQSTHPMTTQQRSRNEERNIGSTSRQQGEHRHNVYTNDGDNATTWANQLQRSLSLILRRLRPQQQELQQRKVSNPLTAEDTSSALIRSEGPAPGPAPQEVEMHQPAEESMIKINDDYNMHDRLHDSSLTTHSQQQESLVTNHPPASSNVTGSASQSARNSWREGSLKTSRFVEHF